MKDRLLSNENSYIYDRIKDKQLFYGDLDVNTKAELDAISEKAKMKSEKEKNETRQGFFIIPPTNN